MKKHILFFVLMFLMITGIAYAKWRTWIPTEKPPVSLKRALEIADNELKNEKTEYYCINAALAATFSNGDWLLSYSSEANKQIWISISSDEKVRKSEKGFVY